MIAMGHARVDNLSLFFVRRLYAKGKLSIAACAEGAAKAGETLNASEGAYDDDYMIRMGLVSVVCFLLAVDADHYNPPLSWASDPVIEPVDMTADQRRAYEAWRRQDTQWWDDDYEVLDSIQWRFRPGWRRKYGTDDMPVLRNISN